MRPRVFPAEDAATGSACSRGSARFNEAAGIPRGRRQISTPSVKGRAGASMRPRVFPAEDSPTSRSS